MKKTILAMVITSIMYSCNSDSKKETCKNAFDYNVEQFSDISILRYRVDGFDNLSLKQKEMIYYLTQAAIEGRDILFDQNGKWNLAVRRTLEEIYLNYTGDKQNEEFLAMEEYLKKVWFSSGIHHHYSSDKFTPKFTESFFIKELKKLPIEKLPLKKNQSIEDFTTLITTIIFDPEIMPKRVNQADGEDLVATSACNYYEGVTQKEAEAFYGKMKKENDAEPIMYGLNSKLVNQNGKVTELVWKVGGMYNAALEKVVYWLDKAKEVAENDVQKQYIKKLIDFNKTGDLKTFDEYAILWVNDTDSEIDFINGFTETYGDPLGMKASWEALVNFKNIEASKRTVLISDNAQWFEDNSPIDSRFKKDEVKGVSAKVINAAMLGGDCYPSTPIGVNLPNSNWIRSKHGSKSVTIENITSAYDNAAQGNGFGEEFIWSDTERELINEFGFKTDNLHTDLHECLGHGSGQLLPKVDPDALKSYGSALEEARADLFGLYYIADDKMLELGLLTDKDAYKAQYYKYLLNGLMTQLIRIEPGRNIEQAHMRNRQLISAWVLDNGAKDSIIELKERDKKTYLVVNDYGKLRELFAELLAEIQRIKSEGDFDAGKALVEKYAVKVNQDIHKEIIARNGDLKIAPYKGFVNPVYTPVLNDRGEITDVIVSYNENYAQQHLRYSNEFSPLPTYN